jgi:hypothetical protein
VGRRCDDPQAQLDIAKRRPMMKTAAERWKGDVPANILPSGTNMMFGLDRQVSANELPRPTTRPAVGRGKCCQMNANLYFNTSRNLHNSGSNKGRYFNHHRLSSAEQRTHLAATLLSAFYPLSLDRDGSTTLLTMASVGRTPRRSLRKWCRMHAQSVFQRMIDSSSGGPSVNYENYSRRGRFSFTALVMLSIVFSPPIAFPKNTKLG